MNIIWLILMCVSIIIAIVTGRVDELTKAMFDAGKSAVEVSLYLLGIVAIWLGITKILEDGGLVYSIAHLFRPLVTRLFKTIPNDHLSISSITLNLLANFFGLGNAATPLGIKAMQDLQTINKTPDTVSDEMMLFLIINTASIQLIPFTAIGILVSFGAANPSAIVLPTIIATAVSAGVAVLILLAFRRVMK